MLNGVFEVVYRLTAIFVAEHKHCVYSDQVGHLLGQRVAFVLTLSPRCALLGVFHSGYVFSLRSERTAVTTDPYCFTTYCHSGVCTRR